MFRALLRLPGWHAFLALLDEFIADRAAKVRHPVTLLPGPGSAMDKMISLEADKGAIIGLRLARSAVDDMIAHADLLQKQKGDDE
jgi:hypothetical protein